MLEIIMFVEISLSWAIIVGHDFILISYYQTFKYNIPCYIRHSGIFRLCDFLTYNVGKMCSRKSNEKGHSYRFQI